MTNRVEDVQKRLMRMAREVDGLTWADRKCIGEAIAMLGGTVVVQGGGCTNEMAAKEARRSAAFDSLPDDYEVN